MTRALQVLKWFPDSHPFGEFPILFPEVFREYQAFLNTNTKTSEEIKQKFLRAESVAVRPEDRRRIALVQIQRLQDLRAIALIHDLHINSLKDLHNVPAMTVLLYASSAVHADVMVHKDKTKEFGYKKF